MSDGSSVSSRPVVFSLALAAWLGAVGYACLGGVSHLLGVQLTKGDWTSIALMAGVGVLGGIAAVLHERKRGRSQS